MTNSSVDQSDQSALSTHSARPLTTTTKIAPQMASSTPRWLLKLLPWLQVDGGTFRVNQRQRVTPDSGIPANEEGEKNIDIMSDHKGEIPLTETFVDYEDNPREFPLSIVQTSLRVHTRVSDLYTDPFDQVKEQLRLVIEGVMERKEKELINNAGNGDSSSSFGLLYAAAPSMRVKTRNGRPTPDDMDELLSKVWKQPCFFVAHPMAIAAFGRECTRRGTLPPTVNMFGSLFLTWRGVPMIPCNKLPVIGGSSSGRAEGKTSILLMRVGENTSGVVGLHKSGIPNEVAPGLSVKLMGIDHKSIATYLVTQYYSTAVLVPDALGVLEDVDVSCYYRYDELGNAIATDYDEPRVVISAPSFTNANASPVETSTSRPEPRQPTSKTSQPKTVWQIGKPGNKGREFLKDGGWQAEFNYIIGSDVNPIDRPGVPRSLVKPGRKRKPKRPSTDKLNIHFTLDCGYDEGQLLLFYDFLGSETDSLMLDGQTLAAITGIGEGKLKMNKIPFPAVVKGKHILSISTDGGNGAHWIDYLKLESGHVSVKTKVSKPRKRLSMVQFTTKLEELIDDLLWTGESDNPIQSVSWETAPISADKLLQLCHQSADLPVETVPLVEFFADLIEQGEYMGPDRIEKNKQLVEFIKANLDDITVYRVVDVPEVHIYLIGTLSPGLSAGISTISIEY